MTDKSGSLDQAEAIAVAGDIVAAYVSNNTMKADQLPDLLQNVFTAVAGLAAGDPAFGGNREPAVPISKSITPDFVICLEDGKKLKMLKRYLRTHYGLSPDEYRRKWGLSTDYPMVAPKYAQRRSKLAKEIGLGTAATKPRKTAKRKTAKKRASPKRRAA